MQRYTQIAMITLLFLVSGGAGLAKLVNPDIFIDQFARFGLPEWFVVVTGMVELVAAALIASFDDLRRRLGGAILAATMAVATLLHLAHDPLPMAVPAFVLMLLAGYGALVPLSKNAKKPQAVT